MSLLPGIQRAAQDILRFWHGRLPWPCVRHALSPKRLGYRLRAHCSPRPCARLPLPRSAAEQAGHEGRDHENRGQRPGRQNHPEDHHHECGGRQPSQPAEQTAWRCSFSATSQRQQAGTSPSTELAEINMLARTTLKPWFAFASRSGHPCPPDEATVERPRSLGAQRERQGAPIVRSHCSRTEERTALYCDEPKSAEHVRVE